MRIQHTKPTMKQQLFLFFMLAAVLVCLIFSAYYFVSEQRVLRNNLERENTKNLQYAIERSKKTRCAWRSSQTRSVRMGRYVR